MFSFRKRFAMLGDTILVYPITTTLLCAICAIALVMIWQSPRDISSDHLELLGKLVLIGLVYVCASAAITKRYSEDKNRHMLWQGLLLLAMIVYFYVLPASIDNAVQTIMIRHVLIQITAITSLLVVVLWTKKRNDQSMYHGVIQLVLHAVLAFLFSWVLAGGIMGAVRGIEQLFNATIVDEWYPTIIAIVGILFGGLTFLDGIRQRKIHEQEPIQPVKWKTLLGRVVGFLLLVYGIILYVYLGKILITGERPSNQVTPLSFAFSGLVVLGSILLIPLVTDKKQTALRKTLLIRMYVALLPILVMVFFAIKLRIGQYGFTEMRYILCALLLWLLISAAYMIISKEKDLWRVAAVFSAVAVVSIIGGPISASGVARNCQEENLEHIVTEKNLRGQDGLLDIARIATLSDDEQQQVAELVRYLIDYHGPTTMEGYYLGESTNAHTVLEELGLPTYRSRHTDKRDFIYLSAGSMDSGIAIDAYTSLYHDINRYTYDKKTSPIQVASGVVVEVSGSDIYLSLDDTKHTIELPTVIEEMKKNVSSTNSYDTTVPRDQFTVSGSGYQILFSHINAVQEDGVFTIEGISFDLLVE